MGYEPGISMTSTIAFRHRLLHMRGLPVLAILLPLLILWYLGAIGLNAPVLRDGYERAGRDVTFFELVADAWSAERPILPAPHQILTELKKTVIDTPPDSRRSLIFHGWVTLSSALLGFALGAALGIALAAAIVHVRTLERSLMPWIIASQTIPILAIAPMIIVVLAALGITGILPKAIISTYLCFFPITIGMAKGLASPDPLHFDLMRTYNASRWQVFAKLRWPISLPFLFTSLKIAIALAIVGAIVGELPTGAQAGIGARLLAGSYYGQTVQIWAALVAAAAMAGVSVAAVGLLERIALRRAREQQ